MNVCMRPDPRDSKVTCGLPKGHLLRCSWGPALDPQLGREVNARFTRLEADFNAVRAILEELMTDPEEWEPCGSIDGERWEGMLRSYADKLLAFREEMHRRVLATLPRLGGVLEVGLCDGEPCAACREAFDRDLASGRVTLLVDGVAQPNAVLGAIRAGAHGKAGLIKLREKNGAAAKVG
jgi:hypothetical protein